MFFLPTPVVFPPHCGVEEAHLIPGIFLRFLHLPLRTTARSFEKVAILSFVEFHPIVCRACWYRVKKARAETVPGCMLTEAGVRDHCKGLQTLKQPLFEAAPGGSQVFIGLFEP